MAYSTPSSHPGGGGVSGVGVGVADVVVWLKNIPEVVVIDAVVSEVVASDVVVSEMVVSEVV